LYPPLANAAAALAALPALFGCAVYIRPQLALDSLEIPTPETEADRKRLYAIVKLSAAREVAFGATTLGIWYWAARRGYWSGYLALGFAMLAKGCMKFSDGLVTQDLVGEGAGKHWMFVPFNFGIGMALLGTF
jgi:hypothetical protein